MKWISFHHNAMFCREISGPSIYGFYFEKYCPLKLWCRPSTHDNVSGVLTAVASPHRQCVLLHCTNSSRKAPRPLKTVQDISLTTKFPTLENRLRARPLESAVVRTALSVHLQRCFGGWCVPKCKNHVSVRTQGLPVEHCIVTTFCFLYSSYCDSFNLTGQMIQWAWFTEDFDPVNIKVHPGWLGHKCTALSQSVHTLRVFPHASRGTTCPWGKSPRLQTKN